MRTKATKLFVCIASLLMWCSHGHAADPGAVVAALQALTSTELNKANRRTIAASAKEYCSVYASAIPTLAPRESDWLKDEVRQGRGIAVLRSVEFFKQQAGERARYCVGWADALLSKLETASRHELNSDEAWLWAQLASNLLDEALRDYVPRLAEQGEVRFNKEEVEASHLSPTLGIAILNRILIPYLAPSE